MAVPRGLAGRARRIAAGLAKSGHRCHLLRRSHCAVLDLTIGLILWRRGQYPPKGDRARTGTSRDSAPLLRAYSAKAIRQLNEGDFSVDDKQILDIVHKTAAELMAANDGQMAACGSVAGTEGG